MMGTSTINLRCPQEVYERIAVLAQRADIPIGTMAIELLTRAVGAQTRADRIDAVIKEGAAN